MSLLKREAEPNFIEKRRVWKSGFDRNRKRSVVFAAIPAMILCLFVILAAPFIVKILDKVMTGRTDMTVREIQTAEEKAPIAELVPPPNPDLAIAEIYQKRFDEEGFDWRAKPVLEAPAEEAAPLPSRSIKPLSVELMPGVSETSVKAEESAN